MNIEDRNERSKGYNNFRGSLHIGMGGLYLVVGGAVIYLKKHNVIAISNGVAYTMAVAMVAYGIFRIWRGWMDLKPKR